MVRRELSGQVHRDRLPPTEPLKGGLACGGRGLRGSLRPAPHAPLWAHPGAVHMPPPCPLHAAAPTPPVPARAGVARAAAAASCCPALLLPPASAYGHVSRVHSAGLPLCLWPARKGGGHDMWGGLVGPQTRPGHRPRCSRVLRCQPSPGCSTSQLPSRCKSLLAASHASAPHATLEESPTVWASCLRYSPLYSRPTETVAHRR